VALRWYGNEVKAQVEAALEQSLDKLASAIEQDCRQSMEYVGKGIDYTPGSGDPRAEWMPEEWRKRFKVRSSAPGDPPAKQTGGVQQTVHIERKSRWVRLIGSRDKIFFWLETGTRKMEPRPSLVPALYKQIGSTGLVHFRKVI
jgi:hypothetical protein